MKLRFYFPAIALIFSATNLLAQHSDVELGYDNTASPTTLIIENDNFTSDGFQFFESEMEELDPFSPGDFSSDEPGFATNGSEGLLVNSGDQIWITTLDATLHSSFGVGYVNYYNPLTDSLEAFGRIGVEDNSASTADLILNGTSVESGGLSQFIDVGDSGGDIHDHVFFDLLDDGTTPLGAYGMMFQLESDFATADGSMDLASEPFWVIWNHGMSESNFDSNALTRFGIGAVPEPGSALVLLCGTTILTFRRKRSKA